MDNLVINNNNKKITSEHMYHFIITLNSLRVIIYVPFYGVQVEVKFVLI